MIIIIQQLFQPVQPSKQMIIKLPKQLTLPQLEKLPSKIELTNFTPQQGEETIAEASADKLIKSYLPIQDHPFYPEQFVKIFLLIKVNSLCRKECPINQNFLPQLAEIYNEVRLNDIVVSYTESEIMSQIFSKIHTKLHLNVEQFKNISEGNGLLAASCVWLALNSEKLLRKQEIAFCLSFISLGGREIAFIPIVHKEKNHAGQIYFADRVSKMFHVKKRSAKEQPKVQDPYSMRCTPQVHGIAYDCLWELKEKATSLINKPHFKFLSINGKKVPNLLVESDTFSLKMDYLICCLQEIGAISFLKSQRILNEYLGKNKLKTLPQYENLSSMLTSTLSFTSKNKILSQMTNFDTCNVDSYKKDIFYNPGSFFPKITELFNNLYYIMTIEVLSALEALNEAYCGNLEQVEFIDEDMKASFQFLRENVSSWDRSGSLKNIKNSWIV